MGKEASRFAPASFLIHFSVRFSGWAEADFVDGSPAASRCLLLACGIEVVVRYLFQSASPSASSALAPVFGFHVQARYLI
ncbi:hypothetical protein [Herbaspirillum robiniae]|uniref:Uncharacterized protein n=1 Tax=Herbaspirillum robiniae TaxID=2014887 RepID=A0A246WPK3_9BURK|nr:hypothetical protein [Herbaspirillum robiniae]OWY28322.1 hypothetical protein CEJ42_13830 [Herbaspirillum robiniae]